MNKRSTFRTIILMTVLSLTLFGGVQGAYATATVTISSGGGGTFVVQGSGFEGVAGVKLSLTYDTATLANPRVAQGGFMSGALMAANTNSPGTIILALIHSDSRGVSGAGPLATITFDLPGSSPGVITSVSTPELVNVKGARLPAVAQYINPSPSSTPTTAGSESGGTTGTSTTTTTTTTTGQGTGSTSPYWLGGVSMPGVPGEEKTPKEKPREEAAPPAPVAETPRELSSPVATTETAQQDVGAAAKEPTAEKKFLAPKSVLDRFKSFDGERTMANFIALFDKPVMETVRQVPAVVLSDGSTPVAVHIELPSTAQETPNFALKGAKLSSLKSEGKNRWLVEALPLAGGYEAAVSILQEGSYMEVPLTVAPPIPPTAGIGKSGKLSAADFELFLKERGSAKESRFDLNGDGKRDSVDDYIFTANYLVKRDSGVKGTTKEQK